MSPPRPRSSPARTRRVLRHEGLRAVVHRGPGRGSPRLGSLRSPRLAPGPTDTGFAAQAGAARSRLFRRGVMDAGRVARAGHDGLRRGKTLVIPGLRNRALAFSVRLSPRIPCHQDLRLHAGVDAGPAVRRPSPAAPKVAANPDFDGLAQSQHGKNPGNRPLHTTLRNQPSPEARAHTAADMASSQWTGGWPFLQRGVAVLARPRPSVAQFGLAFQNTAVIPPGGQ